MATLIDVSVLVAAERGRLDWGRLLGDHAQENIAPAAITASELLHGVHRAEKSIDRTRRSAFVERLLAHLPVIPFDLMVARVHARLWAELMAKGRVVGAHDLFIAATAVATGGRVATRDARSFSKIPGLVMVEW